MEKKTRITKKNINRKKKDKRNNLVLPSNNINNEKSKYLERKSKTQIHPVDIYDTLSVDKNNENNKNGYFKSKNEEDILSSDSNFKENNKNTNGKESIRNKKNKKYKIKKEEKESKFKTNEKKEENYEQRTIIPYNRKNIKLNSIINKQKNKKIFTLLSAEYSIMEYEEAIKNDKRKWSLIYCGYLTEKNFIFNTFIAESFIDLRSIKINFFCFRLEIIFVLNALFIY